MNRSLHTSLPSVLPHRSFHRLVSSNGFAAVMYDVKRARLSGFREHIFKNIDFHVATRELAYDAYFGLRIGCSSGWLSESAEHTEARYLPGTGVIEAVQSFAGIQATTYLFAPFDIKAPAAIMLLHLKNQSNVAL